MSHNFVGSTFLLQPNFIGRTPYLLNSWDGSRCSSFRQSSILSPFLLLPSFLLFSFLQSPFFFFPTPPLSCPFLAPPFSSFRPPSSFSSYGHQASRRIRSIFSFGPSCPHTVGVLASNNTQTLPMEVGTHITFVQPPPTQTLDIALSPQNIPATEGRTE